MARVSVFALLLVLCAPALRAQSILVTGRVLGQDGGAMQQAHVKLTTSHGDELDVRRAADDGAFEFVFDAPGIYRLLFSGVDHRARVVPLFLDGTADTVRLDVGLGRYAWREDLSQALVVGDFNRFSYREGGIFLEPQADGTYSAFVPVTADTLAYQLVNVARNTSGSINGPWANRYEYNYQGSYRSIVDAADDHVRVVVNPRELQETARAAVVAFADTAGSAARYAGLVDVLDALGDDYELGFRELRRQEVSRVELARYFDSFEWERGGHALRQALDGAEGEALREGLYVAYFTRIIRPDADLARQALLEMPPTAAAWGAAPTALGRALEGADDELAASYRQRALQEHPSEDVRAFLLYDELVQAVEADDEEGARAGYAALSSTFPEHRYASVARTRYAPDRAMQVGKTVPAFEVPALGDTATVFSDSTLAGQAVLIDFWATWCGPCIGEMPFLHAADERFGPRGLRILSLSFDQSPETVTSFREGGWPMPWLHAFVEGGFRSPLADTFAINGIPAPILVGPDGTILATGMELRGELLGETLEKHLGDASASGSQ